MKYQIFFYNHESGRIFRYTDCFGVDPWNAVIARLLIEWNSDVTGDGRWLPDGVIAELTRDDGDFQWAVMVLDEEDKEVEVISPLTREWQLRHAIDKLRAAADNIQKSVVIDDPLVPAADADLQNTAERLDKLRDYYRKLQTQYEEEIAAVKAEMCRVASAPRFVKDMPREERELASHPQRIIDNYLADAGYAGYVKT